MLEIRNLFKFENQNIILNNINLKLNKGDILAIVGPTGSGKTCLLKCLLKLTKYDQGEIYFNENKVLNSYLDSKNNGDINSAYTENYIEG